MNSKVVGSRDVQSLETRNGQYSDRQGGRLAAIYDVDVMPHQLRKAHQELDKAVDNLYRPNRFTGERDRVEHLFGLYEKLVAPLAATAPKPRRRRSKRAT